jgi:hypothetical protein
MLQRGSKPFAINVRHIDKIGVRLVTLIAPAVAVFAPVNVTGIIGCCRAG